jgi:hypothetical protein
MTYQDRRTALWTMPQLDVSERNMNVPARLESVVRSLGPVDFGTEW